MKKMIAIILIITGNIYLYAENYTKEDIIDYLSDCYQIVDNSERLEAYDYFADKLGCKIAFGDNLVNWEVRDEVHTFTGSKLLYFVLDAENSLENEEIKLVIKYYRKETNLYIFWNQYIHNDFLEMTIQFDDDELIKQEWWTSSSGEATFCPSANTFIKSILEHKKLVMQLQYYDTTAVFNIQNLKTVSFKYNSYLNWF